MKILPISSYSYNNSGYSHIKNLDLGKAAKSLPIDNVHFCGTHVGKHKIPRYIYHLTNNINYEAILKDGFIITQPREISGYGIYAVELANLFKRWQCDIYNNGYSMIQSLIKLSAKGEDNIVILKIPTAELEQNKLFVRSLNRLKKFCEYPFLGTALMNAKQITREKVSAKVGSTEFINYCQHELKDLLEQKSIQNAEHCIFGTAVTNAPLYKQRKELIEYIYRENIPIDKTEKIGEVNIFDIQRMPDYDCTKPVRSIFASLLSGTPECEGVKLLNC